MFGILIAYTKLSTIVFQQSIVWLKNIKGVTNFSKKYVQSPYTFIESKKWIETKVNSD